MNDRVEQTKYINIQGAFENNLKNCDIKIPKQSITIVTGVSGSGKSSLVFDTILSSSQRNFFYTLSHYFRQFLDLGSRPKVRSISGLSPCISLAQNETLPSIRATVGTLTDIGELLGVLYSSHISKKYCPKHNVEVTGISKSRIYEHITEAVSGNDFNTAICFPLVEKKKGNYKTKLESYYKKGFIRCFIDSSIYTLDNPPDLNKEQKHTIKIIVDILSKSSSSKRLAASVDTALEESGGIVECVDVENIYNIQRFSTVEGCPICGFSWPHLNSRYFSANSLGKCSYCNGLGFDLKSKSTTTELKNIVNQESQTSVDQDTKLALEDIACTHCHGTGLDGSLEFIKINDKSIIDLYSMNILEVKNFLDELYLSLSTNKVYSKLYLEIQNLINKILELKLEYLNLSRRIWSLSRGELQRLKLSGILIENLRGIIYILDEPSQGLHPSEINILIQALKELKQKGNTVILVDHDEMLMRASDHIIDLGPGGGASGGRVVACFTPKEASLYKDISSTAKKLSEGSSDLHTSYQNNLVSRKVDTDRSFIKIISPHYHNLKMNEFSFLKHRLNVITGVSGAGKSSSMNLVYKHIKLFLETGKASSYQCKIEGIEDIKKVELVDKKLVSKSSVSMPATYLDVFTDIRELYGKLPQAQIASVDSSSFSLMKDNGRCQECQGRGQVTLKMKFLSDARITCPVCGGKRYKPFLLDIKYNSLSIADVLDLNLEDALRHFSNHKIITKKLAPAVDLGLGYLKLGLPTISLSGGEAQRLKIVPYLVKQNNSSTCIILDEPTSGLHFEDVEKLMACLRKLTDVGTTVILVEHHPDVIREADWIVDIGPGSSDQGGNLVYEGDLQGLVDSNSITGKYL